MERISLPLTELPSGARPLTLVRIPAGQFVMGSPPSDPDHQECEEPVHRVQLKTDFYLGETLVTQAQWQAVMGTEPTGKYVHLEGEYGRGPDYPVYFVTWDEICRPEGFLDRLNQLGQGVFRLPSEAEWEYACRAETTTRFYCGAALELGEPDSADRQLLEQHLWWHEDASPLRTGQPGYGAQPVALKTPNPWGLYDLHGHLWEWCADDWHDSYAGAPVDGRAWLDARRANRRVVRGGSWHSPARYCRAACRFWDEPVHALYDVGLRLARSVA